MATLTSADRLLVRQEWTQEMMREAETVGIVKADLQAAVDAMDSWFDANALTINAAIPQPARGALTQKQKARLLRFVIKRRYLAGS